MSSYKGQGGTKPQYKQSNNKYNMSTQRPSQTNNNNQPATKSAQYWQPRSITKQKEESIIMIPCINCEEFIAAHLVDKHCQTCVQVSKRVLAIRKSPQIFDEIDYKIKTLTASIEKVMKMLKNQQSSLTGEDSDQKVIYLRRACEIAESVILVQSLSAVEERKLNDVELEVSILSDGYKLSVGVSLYMERLHSLILQKQNVFARQSSKKYSESLNGDRYQRPDSQKKSMQSYKSQETMYLHQTNDTQRLSSTDKYPSSIDNYQNSKQDQLKNLINEKKYEVIQMQNMAQMYQQSTQQSQAQTNNLMRINVHQTSSSSQLSQQPSRQQQYQYQSPLNINQLNNSRVQSSQVQSNGRPTLITKFSGSYDRTLNDDGMKSQILSQIGSSQWGQSEAGQQEDNLCNFQSQSNGDQIQRLFYSKCLGQKMKLAANHPAQKIPVSLLFKEVQSKEIPQGQWDDFISRALQSPYDYLDMNKIANHNNQKILKNNLREMTKDQQFKNKLHQL